MGRMPATPSASDAEPRGPEGASSSLVLHETSLHRLGTRNDAISDPDLSPMGRAEAIAVHLRMPPPLTPAEEAYRHGRWRERRRAVRESLVRQGAGVARLTRFDRCGALMRVQCSPSTGAARMVGWYCRDRWCEPCGKSRSLKIAARLDEWMGDRKARALTLTIQSNGQSLDRKSVV